MVISMRSLAEATEQHLNEQLAWLVAQRWRALDSRQADVRAAIAAAMAQDDHLRRLLPQLPAVAARESRWMQWRERRRIASSFRQLQFAIRRYEHASAELVRIAAGLVRDADLAVAEARSY